MTTIITEVKKDIAVLTLNNGTTNTITPDLVKDFSAALDTIKNDVKGMVLCGGTKFFSIGFDLPLIIHFDRKEMSDFWYGVNDLFFKLYTLPLPTVCALSGHAVAGGNIIALTCDYRFSDSDTRKIGLNEIKLGVPAPYLADMMLRQIVGDRSAAWMLYTGDFITFSQAEKMGLIDTICSPETMMSEALEKVTLLSQYPMPAFSAIKSNRTEEIRHRYKKNGPTRNEVFLDCWFSKPTRRLLAAACEKF